MTAHNQFLFTCILQLKVYAIFLGDFGLFSRQSFVSVFSLVLAVLYTFCASVVLLNVLIAIASDSVRGSAFELLSKMDGMSLTLFGEIYDSTRNVWSGAQTCLDEPEY
jgi:hypothetical protein